MYYGNPYSHHMVKQAVLDRLFGWLGYTPKSEAVARADSLLATQADTHKQQVNDLKSRVDTLTRELEAQKNKSLYTITKEKLKPYVERVKEKVTPYAEGADRRFLKSWLGDAEKGLFHTGYGKYLVSTPLRRLGAAGTLLGTTGGGLYLGLSDSGDTSSSLPELPAVPSSSDLLSSPQSKALAGLAALGLLGGGAYMLSRSGRDKKEKRSYDRFVASQIMLGHLDKVASFAPLEQQYPIRTIQQHIAAGNPLSYAIKMAFPYMSGEQRGILAAQLCRDALRSLS